MTVHRWVFDDGAGETYTVPINPNRMSKIRPARNITTKVTTAMSGQTLFFEGRASPQTLTFSGVILEKVHLDDLTHWVYSKGRITITDHFLRVLSVILTDLDAQPKRSHGRYWRHDYTVTGICYAVDETSAILTP